MVDEYLVEFLAHGSSGWPDGEVPLWIELARAGGGG